MELKQLKNNWERHAQTDPMWAILAVPEKLGRKWNAEEFFQSGKAEIAAIFRDAEGFGISWKWGKALDFGCGIGRLTQAMCNYFESCYGVDIAHDDCRSQQI
jgi:tRNA/tmRNA/rRNA uracil-C5-methylase (TrmA/RlmC/RlmD family)